MRLEKFFIVVGIIFGCFLVSGCTQNDAAPNIDNSTLNVLETEEIFPTDIVEVISEPTEISTQVPEPTASIDYIDNYYSELEDLSEWKVFSKNDLETYEISNSEGGLSLSFAEEEDYFIAYSNVFGSNTVIEIEFNHTEGTGQVICQVICRSSDDGGYLFEIDTSGSWEIGKTNFGSQMVESITSGSSDAILHGNQVNKIIVECNQDQLALLINDVLIIQEFDQTYSDGFAGFGIRNGDDSTSIVNISYFYVSAP